MRKFIASRLLRRFGPAKRVTDAAILGGAALRYAHRRGWVSESAAKRFGAPDSSGGEDLSIGELLILGAAAFRLLRRVISKRRGSDRLIIDIE